MKTSSCTVKCTLTTRYITCHFMMRTCTQICMFPFIYFITQCFSWLLYHKCSAKKEILTGSFILHPNNAINQNRVQNDVKITLLWQILRKITMAAYGWQQLGSTKSWSVAKQSILLNKRMCMVQAYTFLFWAYNSWQFMTIHDNYDKYMKRVVEWGFETILREILFNDSVHILRDVGHFVVC